MDGYLGTQMMLAYPVFFSFILFLRIVKFNRRGGEGRFIDFITIKTCLLQQAMMEIPNLIQVCQINHRHVSIRLFFSVYQGLKY